MKKMSESIQSIHLSFMPGVEAIFGLGIANEFRRHIHKTYIIGLVTEGQRIITDSHGSVIIPEKEMFILNPGHVHSCRTGGESGHSYRIVSVESRTMQVIASQISGQTEEEPYFMNIHCRDDALCRRLKALFETMEEPDSEIQVESDLNDFLSQLILDLAESPPQLHVMVAQADAVKKACEYISNHFTEKNSLEKLAEIACLSPFHFQREFKNALGITPHEYLSDFRIGQAKTMLLTSEHLADIAVQLGFFDQGHFSKVFKKSVGISPGKYARINK